MPTKRGYLGTPEERFWRKVDQRSPDECWLWTASTTKRGYGCFMVAPNDMQSAHRYSWILSNGKIPDGLVVCHRCDTPRCINPGHLFLGTQGDNVRDAYAKKRMAFNSQFRPWSARGTQYSTAKLCDPAVRMLRKCANAGVPQNILSVAFGVSRSLVSIVARGKSWEHVS